MGLRDVTLHKSVCCKMYASGPLYFLKIKFVGFEGLSIGVGGSSRIVLELRLLWFALILKACPQSSFHSSIKL